MNRCQTLTAVATASAALFFLVAGTAVASSHGHTGHTSGAATTADSHQQMMMKQVDAKARVLAVAADGKSVKIDHQPIPELGWPAMQMSLDLESPDLAAGLGAGDQVTVTIKQLSATQYVISNIKK
jgi:Cu/Ag efflux protein CusF